ncbi:MAG TPA: hypothetical protein VE135_28225 [Pyrinomonadaceae bacterium]|nr:hypothetical protein [Pyrinomonadaceae bacterium]
MQTINLRTVIDSREQQLTNFSKVISLLALSDQVVAINNERINFFNGFTLDLPRVCVVR